MKPQRLLDLVSVGPATIRDLKLLGIISVSQLKGRSAKRLYDQLNTLTGERHDPCCQDVFAAAIAQANNPNLPTEKKQWWYWSKARKKNLA